MQDESACLLIDFHTQCFIFILAFLTRWWSLCKEGCLKRSNVVIKVDELGKGSMIGIDTFGESDMIRVNTIGTRSSEAR